MAISSFLSATPAPATLQFSVCAIITNRHEFEEMKQSFEQCGFNTGCEFLVADNTSGQQFDAYTAINRFLKEAQGEFLIIAHQDVRCIDDSSLLISILNELSTKDPLWAVCGNAGAVGYHQDVRYIVNGGDTIIHENLPLRVFSLDENMLIVRRSANLVVSSDLSGFHFYGTDLCILADYLGYHCYVIPFMVEHLSLGNLKQQATEKNKFLEKFGYKLRSRFIQTPSTKFVLCQSALANKLSNGLLFFLVKWNQGIRWMFKIKHHKEQHRKTVRKGRASKNA